MNLRVIRLPEVLERTGLSRYSIHVFMDEGRFPKQVKVGCGGSNQKMDVSYCYLGGWVGVV